jgi:histidine ammonia-lyase
MRSTSDGPVVLDGRSLRVEDVVSIAHGRGVALAPATADAMRRGRAVVERYVAESIPAYGLTTGLGMRADQRLSAAELAEFSYRTLRGRAQAVGPPVPAPAVRAAMVVRLNTLLDGAAGASPGVATFVAEALNRGLVPKVPRIGSIGSGDLAAMACIGLAFVGEGVMVVDGEERDAGATLAGTGLEQLRLAAKDGAVLCNNSALSCGLAALALDAARTAWGSLQIAGALSLAAFAGNASPFDAAVLRLRPQPGQVAAGDAIRTLVGDELPEPRRLQDPLSMRCLAAVNGAALAALDDLDACLTVELNATPDNPAVLVDEGRCVSTANFHSSRLAQTVDAGARALAWCANDSVSRVERLASAALSGLPPLLTTEAPDRAGFGPMLKPLEALRAQVVHLSEPVPILPSHNADGVEDAVTFAALAATKLDELLASVRLIAAFELIAAAQAADLRHTPLSPALARVHALVRGVSPFLDDDRPIAAEVEALAGLVASGELERQAYRKV